MNKQILTTAVLALLVTGQAFAQSMVKTASKPSFGIRAGVNFQNINGKDASGDDLENELTTGFHGGVNAELPLGTGFYLQPGVLYSQKGAAFENDVKVRLSYIEVPVNFVYKPILGTGNMILGFGPYVGFGIGGKIKYGNIETDIEFDRDYNALDPASRFKSFDAGGNLLAGYEFANRLSFQLNAQLGLVNINKENPANNDDDTRWRNTGFGLSLGYRF
ncbi:MAG TPA: porin family protein [Flavisolibacter sp.]|nr:porin family protein [Flavisolibacter sp.]